jgi:hypothetical protein
MEEVEETLSEEESSLASDRFDSRAASFVVALVTPSIVCPGENAGTKMLTMELLMPEGQGI